MGSKNTPLCATLVMTLMRMGRRRCIKGPMKVRFGIVYTGFVLDAVMCVKDDTFLRLLLRPESERKPRLTVPVACVAVPEACACVGPGLAVPERYVGPGTGEQAAKTFFWKEAGLRGVRVQSVRALIELSELHELRALRREWRWRVRKVVEWLLAWRGCSG